tara:strand:+ start:102 stop:272 length:171 start_codon:yes stop_codon:yes gene_type:complete
MIFLNMLDRQMVEQWCASRVRRRNQGEPKIHGLVMTVITSNGVGVLVIPVWSSGTG